MLEFLRFDGPNEAFTQLVKELDAYLTVTDEDEHDFYDQYNKIDSLKHIVLAYHEGKPVACGAIKKHDANTMEIKRMYTNPSNRGKGVATQLLDHLESWAAELGYQYCILETGIRQPEAIALYKKCSYIVIENYGQYIGVENSVCFLKNVISSRG